jgi:DNA-binding transcriptional ArsR family regulator
MDAPAITRLAGLIGEAGRIQMLTALLDGNAHSASQLAMSAAVSPQTASSHLAKLLSGDLIISERNGRHRLFRLKNAGVAAAIESLAALARPSAKPPVLEIRFARTCYDHLAGVLAIALRNELVRKGAFRHADSRNGKSTFVVTPAGKKLLYSLDIDVASLLTLRRSFAHKCLDWTERRPHIGGAVGAALLTRFLEKKWLVRIAHSRAVRVTHDGERAFDRHFNVHCAALRVSASAEK